MRGRLTLLLLAGCADAPKSLDGLVPAVGSVRGGETVCVAGSRLGEAPRLTFDGVEAKAAKPDAEGRPCVVTPPHLAGAVPVQVALAGGDTLVTAFQYVPLELAFIEAAPHYVPSAAWGLVDGVLLDVDADGRDDVVVLDAAGGLSVWRNDGLGALTEGPQAALEGKVGGLAPIPWGPAEALFVCHADGEAARVAAPSDGLLVPVDGAVPAEPGACRGAAAVDVDGDGAVEVVELRTDDTLRIWTIGDGALSRWTAAAAVDLDTCPAVVTSGIEAECVAFGGSVTFFAEGDGEAALVLPLPPIARPDDGLVLRVAGDLIRVEVVDGAGQTFATTPTGVGEYLARVTLPAVATWSTEATPVAPLTSLRLVLRGGAAGAPDAVEVGGATLAFPDGGQAAAFAPRRWPADAEGIAAQRVLALDTDADDQPELVAATGSGPVLLVRAGDAFATSPALSGVECAAGDLALTDIEGDGLDELALTCEGQDRLLRNDGHGAFFDDTVSTLPVDAGAGRGLLAADLDLDALPELVIATWEGVDRLYWSDGARYIDRSPELGLLTGAGTRPLALDVDDDGDLDLLVLQGSGASARLLVMTGE